MREVVRLLDAVEVAFEVKKDGSGVTVRFGHNGTFLSFGLTNESAERIGRALSEAARPAGDVPPGLPSE